MAGDTTSIGLPFSLPGSAILYPFDLIAHGVLRCLILQNDGAPAATQNGTTTTTTTADATYLHASGSECHHRKAISSAGQKRTKLPVEKTRVGYCKGTPQIIKAATTRGGGAHGPDQKPTAPVTQSQSDQCHQQTKASHHGISSRA